LKEGPERVRLSAITGPGMCGADFPLRVSALGGESAPLSYDDEPLRPPAAIPDATLPQHWPLIRSNALPPPAPPPYPPQSVPAQVGTMPSGSMLPRPIQVQPPIAQQPGAPMSLYAPGVATPQEEDDEAFEPTPPRPYNNTAPARANAAPPTPYPPSYYPPNYSPRAQPALPPDEEEEHVPLGPSRAPRVTGAIGPVEVKPAATLACPIVSALDQWITVAVQPAAMRWFRQPVVEIKQISAYSCRGMNGDSSAHISEHAFGNALDVAAFVLADGHKISVQYGWRGTPEEQGFLHDVQLAACQEFTTVLAPGANVYHYNHIHVDLMRRSRGRHICEPSAIPGAVAAERARARYAAQHRDDPAATGSIKKGGDPHVLGYSGGDDRLPLAIPGED
jgi:hypothetical protein